MGPSARLKAAAELLHPLTENPEFLPIDQALSNYTRNRRFIGAKDRRAIRETVYMVLRCWQALAVPLTGAGARVTGRNLILGFLKITGALDQALFEEGKYGLEPLSETENAWLAALEPAQTLPEWAALNCPEWLFQAFRARFGDKTGPELEALNERAGFDIRLNSLKTQPRNLDKDLTDLGFGPGRFLLTARHSDEENNISHYKHYINGNIEIQDEGSQMASRLAGARPGRQVIDLCAGAGGKTLAMAADMQNQGQVFAFDIAKGKIKALDARLRRAGARNVQTRVIPETGPERAKILADFAGKMDLVVLDVPCSGTGIWRRSPDARLRLTPEKLETYQTQQRALLSEGACLVKPGGRLTYITCSLLEAENETQIEAFLTAHQGWKIRDFREDGGLKDIKSLARTGGALLLTPNSHGTDGFFVTVLEKPGG